MVPYNPIGFSLEFRVTPEQAETLSEKVRAAVPEACVRLTPMGIPDILNPLNRLAYELGRLADKVAGRPEKQTLGIVVLNCNQLEQKYEHIKSALCSYSYGSPIRSTVIAASRCWSFDTYSVYSANDSGFILTLRQLDIQTHLAV